MINEFVQLLEEAETELKSPQSFFIFWNKNQPICHSPPPPFWHSTIYTSLSCFLFLSQHPSLAASDYFLIVSLSLSPLILFCFVLLSPPIFSFARYFFFAPLLYWSSQHDLQRESNEISSVVALTGLHWASLSFTDKIFKSSCNSFQCIGQCCCLYVLLWSANHRSLK